MRQVRASDALSVKTMLGSLCRNGETKITSFKAIKVKGKVMHSGKHASVQTIGYIYDKASVKTLKIFSSQFCQNN